MNRLHPGEIVGMEAEVLSWDDASNNRFILSGKGSWTPNAISIYPNMFAKVVTGMKPKDAML